jgi:hypothetical protein
MNNSNKHIEPNVVVEWLTPLIRIREVPGSILRPGGRLSRLRFLWFSSVPPGECRESTLKLGHDRFLPSFFQFIIFNLSYHWRYIVKLLRKRPVSILSGYGLEDLAIVVRSPAEANNFFSNLWVETGFGAHPASCPMGTRGPFSGGKAQPGRNVVHSPTSSAEVVNK